MVLFCDKCKENHEFSDENTERIIYSLSADYACAAVQPDYDRPKFKDSDDAMMCLNSVLGNSNDVEVFWEYVNSMVAAKQFKLTQ